MASDLESHLLSALESARPMSIFPLFSDYLRPFSDPSNPKKSKNKRDETPTTRSLAKQYLPLLNKSLSLLPKRLAEPVPDEIIRDLISTYQLCLDCLELISSQLNCKPHKVQIQRLRLVSCLEALRLYDAMESEALKVLERLRGADLGHGTRDVKGRLLPDADSGDPECGIPVVHAVSTIIKSVAMQQQGRDSGRFRQVLHLLEEIRPWFRKLDANDYERFHKVVVNYLGKCALCLAREAGHFERDLVRALCLEALKEYLKSSLKDQSYKFARQICSCLFSSDGVETVCIMDMLYCVLRCLAREIKAGADEMQLEFIELVSYFANKCRAVGTIPCTTVARHINDIAADVCKVSPPVNLILRFYGTGLFYSIFNAKFEEGNVSSLTEVKDDSGIGILLSRKSSRWRELAALLDSFQNTKCSGCLEDCAPSPVEYECPHCRIWISKDTNLEALRRFPEKRKDAYILHYLGAMQFLCQPLANMINSEKRQVLCETNLASPPSHLSSIQEIFHQFFHAYLHLKRCMALEERRRTDYDKSMLNVAVATFILSVRTQLKMKSTVHLVKQIIGSQWIQPQELKYLYASFYNVGVALYRNKRLEVALKALKICHTASLTCIGLFCRMFASKSEASHNDLSEEAIVDFVNEACNGCAFLLDVLHQCGNHKINKYIVDSLDKWTDAEKVVRCLPGPAQVVKQWVKKECTLHKNLDPVNGCTTLYSVLSSSTKFSRRACGKILQQELLAYEKMFPQCPQSWRIQVEITDILLRDVYTTKDDCLQKSWVLLWKGRALRKFGTEWLKDCIQCLSEAISLMDGTCYESSSSGNFYHQLAVAYCLRASCIQEAEPYSKQVLEDISAAINLWLKVSVLHDCHEDASYSILPEHAITLLYSTIDLLAVKGYIDLHQDMCKLILRLAKRKNVQMENCVSMLWACRRFTHALCASTIDENLILTFPEYCGKQSESIEFWLSCMKISNPLLVGFRQSFSLHLGYSPSSPYNNERTFQLDTKVDDVKNAAAELLSSAPVPSRSTFIAGHLYYDLCEKLISNGQLSEALSCAKEAHRLRTQIFQQNFGYSVEKQLEKYNDAGKMIQMRKFSFKDFQLLNSVACDVWPSGTTLRDINGFYLSPWNVLQCYLESILQVGVVNELMGNGSEAETFMLWGKSISCSQSLSIFTVAFSSSLGNIYCKKQLWDLAEKELQNAKRVLIESGKALACSKCRLLIEVTLDKQLAELSCSLSSSKSGSFQMLELSYAEDLFKAALDKLNHSVWENCISCPVEASGNVKVVGNTGKRNTTRAATRLSRSSGNQSDRLGSSAKHEPKALKDTRKCRTSKTTPKCTPVDDIASQFGSRLTRSKSQFLNSEKATSANMQIIALENSSRATASDLADFSNEGNFSLEKESARVNCCTCGKVKCWRCLIKEVEQSGLLINLTSLKWESCRRRLLLAVLTGLGKCLRKSGQHHEGHEVTLQSIYALSNGNAFFYSYASVIPLVDCIVKEFPGDAFSIERASIIYNICRFALKEYSLKDARSACCDFSRIPAPKMVSWLMLAFVLSREVPTLFQKVAKLLATLFLLSVSNDHFLLPSFCNELSESHWASYFHQASLGTHINCRFFSNSSGKIRPQSIMDTEGSNCSPHINDENLEYTRLAPNSTKDLPDFVKKFFNHLPSSLVICISLLGSDLAASLREMLDFPSSVRAWMFLSRIRLNQQPLVMLLPVDSVLEDDDITCLKENLESKDSEIEKRWQCPWGSTVVDDVAPSFKLLLKENYYSSAAFPSIHKPEENRVLWWTRRRKLDQCLGEFLRNLEDLWLGPWRNVLLGEWLDCKVLDTVHKRLVKDLKSKCKLDVNETLLRVVLSGGMQGLKEEACIAQLCSKNGCYVGSVGYFKEENCTMLTGAVSLHKNRCGLALQLLQEAIADLNPADHVYREPTVLVLDSEVQMLPWENIPILRKQEVYRMPSVGSITAMLNRLHTRQEQLQHKKSSFPSIDPLDAFYLLNPDGDLSGTQMLFEGWFRDKNLKGQAGSRPSVEELVVALRSHDLFLYFGHGSGAQYISRRDIESLDKCAATFLMGCSSGTFLLNGCYIPQGVPLSYLRAGSPVIVANLWEVTDKDIDRFGKAMLEAWLRERSSCFGDCSECTTSVANEFAAMKLEGYTRKGSLRNCKAAAGRDRTRSVGSCEHRRKIGSFMGDARNACTLPFLTGAAPVCYGLPTGIRTKNLDCSQAQS